MHASGYGERYPSPIQNQASAATSKSKQESSTIELRLAAWAKIEGDLLMEGKPRPTRQLCTPATSPNYPFLGDGPYTYFNGYTRRTTKGAPFSISAAMAAHFGAARGPAAANRICSFQCCHLNLATRRFGFPRARRSDSCWAFEFAHRDARSEWCYGAGLPTTRRPPIAVGCRIRRGVEAG